MGREVRRVSPNWEHPKDERGAYVPLFDGASDAAQTAIARWQEGKEQWEAGYRESFDTPKVWQPLVPAEGKYTWEAWAGECPDPADYMPDFGDKATHFQMYETCTEGTPISPVVATPEVLARWLADNGASAFGGMTASYEQWLAMIGRGWAPSAMVSAETGLVSGVEAVGTWKEGR